MQRSPLSQKLGDCHFFSARKIQTCFDLSIFFSPATSPTRLCYHHSISATTGCAGSREQNGQFLPWGTSLLLLPAGAVGHILSHMLSIHLDVVEYVKGKCLRYRGVFTSHWCYWVLHWDDQAINTGAVYTEPFPWKSQAIYMLIIPLNASE